MRHEPEIPKYDAQRALKVMEYEKKTEPKYRRPNSYGSCLVFALALIVAGVIVFYIFRNREMFGRLWQRATHPDSVPALTDPGQ